MSNKKTIVVIDTNLCRNNSGINNFLGNREELEKISQNATIILPEIVVQEVISQKKRSLHSNRSQFEANPFSKLVKINSEDLTNFDIDAHIEALRQQEAIQFISYELNDPIAAFRKIQHWSINKLLPFSPDEKSGDKGFKDAVIACAVDEILDDLQDEEHVVFYTQDGLLSDKYRGQPGVRVAGSLEEVEKMLLPAFVDDYLLKKIAEELALTNPKLTSGWLNTEGNWVLKLVDTEGLEVLVIIDLEGREMLDSTILTIKEIVDTLIKSSSFQTTHSAIELLQDLVNFLDYKALLSLILASVENQQIYWIATDEDVKSFFIPIFESLKGGLDQETKNRFLSHFKV